MYIFLPLALLPFFEIAGFVMIGSEFGLVNTLLWTTGATLLGLLLLKTGGLSALNTMRTGGTMQTLKMSDLFDHMATFIGALLLIFPGFISDFLAIPFLIAPLRGLVFDHFNEKHKAAYKDKTQHPHTGGTVIEGEYTVKNTSTSPNNDNNHLPKH